MKVFRIWLPLAFILVSKVQSLEVPSEDDEDTEELTKFWAIELDQDDESLAQEVAKKHGYSYEGRIGSLPNHFLLVREEDAKKNGHRDGKRGDIQYPSLREHPNVKWHEQQRTLTLEKRGYFDHYQSSQQGLTEDEHKDLKYCNDPKFSEQWYIASYGQNSEPKGSDMGILEAWKQGYTGKGVRVTVMDDGLDHTHPDLKHNYDPKASIDLNGGDPDPKPRDKPDQYHGTKCSGEIGAQANNSICGVGIAPDVSLGGIRMLDGNITGVTEAKAFGLRPNYIDVLSASWGPKDNGQTFGSPSVLGKRALEHGAKHGREGRGTIYVWASGNGGASHDDCDCDGYASSIYTIAIGAVSARGTTTYYDEKCASTMAVVYSGDSGGGFSGYHNLITTGRYHTCLSHFGGTSAAAPLAAGIFALVLQANKELTWRDLQHIITQNAKINDPHDSQWKTNGAGFKINHKFGFGLLYAPALIRAAKTWKRVPKQVKCEIKVKLPSDKRKRAIKRAGRLSFSVQADACKGTPNFVKKLEHVQAVINLRHRQRGVLSIDIESPSKTESRLLAVRPLDKSKVGVKDWPFTTVHMWGEDPLGEWKLTIRDNTVLHDKRLSKHTLNDNEINVRQEPDGDFDTENLNDDDDDLIMEDEAIEVRRPFRHEIELEDESEDEGRQNFAREEDEDSLNIFDVRSNIYGALDSWSLLLYGTGE